MTSHGLWISLFAGAISNLYVSTDLYAAINPFTEHFVSGHANWHDSSGTAPVNWISSGGPDGSSFVSTVFNFENQAPGLPIPSNATALFRAQDEFNSSSHAFEGDWLAAGVTQFSFWVRHNAPTEMNFFVRFATAANHPAWSGVAFAPIAPGLWTQITIDIDFANPNLFFEGPPPTILNFNQVFGNVGHIQVGAFGGQMAGIDQSITFDLDQPAIVPLPSALTVVAFLGVGGGLIMRPRRR